MATRTLETLQSVAYSAEPTSPKRNTTGIQGILEIFERGRQRNQPDFVQENAENTIRALKQIDSELTYLIEDQGVIFTDGRLPDETQIENTSPTGIIIRKDFSDNIGYVGELRDKSNMRFQYTGLLAYFDSQQRLFPALLARSSYILEQNEVKGSVPVIARVAFNEKMLEYARPVAEKPSRSKRKPHSKRL